MKIVVDRSRCIGASNCLAVAPRVFMLDGARKAIVIDAAGAEDAALIRAATVCPTGAIQLYDDATGERIAP
ncbi:MAG TPA: ferredoxin [Candidatus Polarisedimenticolia bacterium]|nr:ferredoxin [Candidatus Polarisedimenticolia bacterium]